MEKKVLMVISVVVGIIHTYDQRQVYTQKINKWQYAT